MGQLPLASLLTGDKMFYSLTLRKKTNQFLTNNLSFLVYFLEIRVNIINLLNRTLISLKKMQNMTGLI